MLTLEISEGFRSQVDNDILKEAAKATLRHELDSAEAELTIIITNDEQLRTLNYQFRDIDSPTDVLSFTADFIDPENKAPYLGDILISFPRAAQQAADGRHSIMAELQLLVIHGVLHLLGYDHAETQEKEEMWSVQNEILRQLGLESLKILDRE